MYTLVNGSTSNFKIDMNFGKLEDYFETNAFTKERIKVYNIYGILSDKLKVLSTQKVRRRIKDLLDVYYLANSTNINLRLLVDALERKYPEIKSMLLEDSCFTLNPTNYSFLEQAYSKFNARGVDRVNFEEVYSVVAKFSSIVYEELLGVPSNYDVWNTKSLMWERSN